MNHSQVVRIFATSQAPDYGSPWQTQLPENGTGSGVVIGADLVLTGAHVVAEATFVQVQTVTSTDKVVAEVVAICHDADLALLRVRDAAIFKGIEFAELGELPQRQARVSVVGYPVGGEELSITEGVVSRLEVQRYAHSGRRLLAITVDAAINSGNSGGPVYQDGLVVGIAFQSIEEADSIGEAVPVPLIRQFLRSVEEGREPRIPALAVRFQVMENENLRRHCGLGQGQSGLLVRRVSSGGTGDGALEPRDVITELGGLALANNGTVLYREKFRTRWPVVLGEHFIGDKLPVKGLRGGKPFEVQLNLGAPVPLVTGRQYGQEPRFFVFAGCVFQSLTEGFLQTWDDWKKNAPPEFVNLYYAGVRTNEQREVVVLSQVLGADITAGYRSVELEAVTSVGGQTPRDMLHFVALVEGSRGVVDIECSSGQRLLFDVEQAKTEGPRILERYQIPRDRSRGLLEIT